MALRWSKSFVPLLMKVVPARPRRSVLSLMAAIAASVLLAACGGPSSKVTGAAGADDWSEVRTQARGQTVRWWMYGGDDRVNAYVDHQVRPALARLGVGVDRIPITDTADALKRVVAQRRAGDQRRRRRSRLDQRRELRRRQAGRTCG